MKANNVIQIVLVVLVLGVIGFGIASSSNKTKNNPSTNTESSSSGVSKVDLAAVSDGDQIRGDKNASVTLVEYSDYQCPYCVTHYPTMKELVSQYDGKVRWVFRHFPLPFHKQAPKAAEAAEAAGAQGKFWEYSDLLIKNSTQDGRGLKEDDLIKYAEQLGLNMDKFKDDLSSGRYKTKVDADYATGEKAGVNGTPATFIVDKQGNVEEVSGAASIASMKTKIDKALNVK